MRIDHRSLSVVYVTLTVIVIFGVWIPGRFLTTDSVASILNNSSVYGLVSLALLLPLAAGLFDFSIGYTLGLSSVWVAWLLGNTHLGVVGCVLLTLIAAALIGVLNGVVVVVLRIDSFIGTLATGSLLVAVNLMVSGNQILTTGVTDPEFLRIAQAGFGKVTITVMYFLLLAVGLWYLMSQTSFGRRLYATGLSVQAARLAGVRTDAIRFLSLVASATIAGAAGIIVTAQIGAGSPDVGPPYLIPAYAAAFLGLAQSRHQLFNVWGTVAAVILTAVTTAGLARAGAPVWAPYLFTGAVLIAAVGFGGFMSRSRGVRAARDVAEDLQLTEPSQSPQQPVAG